MGDDDKKPNVARGFFRARAYRAPDGLTEQEADLLRRTSFMMGSMNMPMPSVSVERIRGAAVGTYRPRENAIRLQPQRHHEVIMDGRLKPGYISPHIRQVNQEDSTRTLSHEIMHAMQPSSGGLIPYYFSDSTGVRHAEDMGEMLADLGAIALKQAITGEKEQLLFDAPVKTRRMGTTASSVVDRIQRGLQGHVPTDETMREIARPRASMKDLDRRVDPVAASSTRTFFRVK